VGPERISQACKGEARSGWSVTLRPGGKLYVRILSLAAPRVPPAFLRSWEDLLLLLFFHAVLWRRARNTLRALALFLCCDFFVLTGDHQTRGQVGNAHGRVGRVPRAAPRGPLDLKTSILRSSGVTFTSSSSWLTKNGHGHSGRMNPPLRLGFRDPLTLWTPLSYWRR